MFIAWIAFQIHSLYEKLEKKEIEGIILDGTDFTVDVKNIPEHTDIRVLKAQIWRHIETVLKDHPEFAVLDKNDPNAHKVAQCNFALSKFSLMFYYKMRLTYEKKDRIAALKEALLKRSYMEEEKKNAELFKLKYEREIIKQRYEHNEETIIKLRSMSDIRASKVYITMQSMEGKQRLKRAFHYTRMRR